MMNNHNYSNTSKQIAQSSGTATTTDAVIIQSNSIVVTDENAWRRFAFEVCRQILIIWWRVDKYKPVLQNLFLFSNQNAMKLMQKDMTWFHEHTDVVEQYCTCLAKLLKQKYYDLFEKLPADSFLYLIRFGN